MNPFESGFPDDTAMNSAPLEMSALTSGLTDSQSLSSAVPLRPSVPVLSLPDAKSSKARRVGTACEPCNRLKVKCSGEIPCSRCTRLGRAQNCVLHQRRPRGFKKQASATDAASSELSQQYSSGWSNAAPAPTKPQLDASTAHDHQLLAPAAIAPSAPIGHALRGYLGDFESRSYVPQTNLQLFHDDGRYRTVLSDFHAKHFNLVKWLLARDSSDPSLFAVCRHVILSGFSMTLNDFVDTFQRWEGLNVLSGFYEHVLKRTGVDKLPPLPLDDGKSHTGVMDVKVVQNDLPIATLSMRRSGDIIANSSMPFSLVQRLVASDDDEKVVGALDAFLGWSPQLTCSDAKSPDKTPPPSPSPASPVVKQEEFADHSSSSSSSSSSAHCSSNSSALTPSAHSHEAHPYEDALKHLPPGPRMRAMHGMAFLGLVRFLRDYSPALGEQTLPLMRAPVSWDMECNKQFEQLLGYSARDVIELVRSGFMPLFRMISPADWSRWLAATMRVNLGVQQDCCLALHLRTKWGTLVPALASFRSEWNEHGVNVGNSYSFLPLPTLDDVEAFPSTAS